MGELTVDIITAERSFLVGTSAESITAPGFQGTFQVLPQHTTFLTALDVGPVTVETAEGLKHYVISGGFAEVMQDHVRILADHAEAAGEINTELLKESLESLEGKLAEAEPFSEQAEALQQERRYLESQRELAGQ